MTIEVRCPGCDAGYLVEATGSGEELWCPACARPVPVPVEPASATAALPDARVPETTVCPRCKLHFTPRPGSPAEPSAVPTVLIVEDQPYFLDVATTALSAAHRVRTAASVVEARDVLARLEVDLMLLDPAVGGGRGGLELLRGLGTKPCPILLFTDRDESELYGDTWNEYRALGADDIVVKSMNLGDVLAGRVAALLGRGGE